MSFDNILIRIKQETDIKTLTELAEFTGTTQPHVSRKKKTDNFPVEWAYKIARKYGLLTEWILTGEGPKRLDERVDTTLYHFKILAEFDTWLSEVVVDQPYRKDWAKGILLDAFPMFKEWLKRREDQEGKDSIFSDKKLA